MKIILSISFKLNEYICSFNNTQNIIYIFKSFGIIIKYCELVNYKSNK